MEESFRTSRNYTALKLVCNGWPLVCSFRTSRNYTALKPVTGIYQCRIGFRTSRNYTALKHNCTNETVKKALERAEITQLSNGGVKYVSFRYALERAEITQLSNNQKHSCCQGTGFRTSRNYTALKQASYSFLWQTRFRTSRNYTALKQLLLQLVHLLQL